MKTPVSIENDQQLRAAIESRTMEVLQAVLKLLGCETKYKKKPELVALYLACLAPERLPAIYHALDDLSKCAVAEIIYAKRNYLDYTGFLTKYGEVPRLYRPGNSAKELRLLDTIVFASAIPPSLVQQFRTFVPPPAPWAPETYEVLPPPSELPYGDKEDYVYSALTETPALHDVHAVLRLAGAKKVAINPESGRPTLAGARALAATLLHGDYLDSDRLTRADQFLKAFAWPILVQAGGLVRPGGKKLELTAKGQRALGQAPHLTIRSLWQDWMQYTQFDEFSRITEIKGQTKNRGRNMTPVPPRRAAIASVLRTLPVNRWITIDEFFRTTVMQGADFSVAKNEWDLYILHAEYGSLGYAGSSRWDLLEGRYIMVLLFEYAATLGMLDVVWVPAEYGRSDYSDRWGGDSIDYLSMYDGLRCFRLTPLGAFCLGMTDAYSPPLVEKRPILKVLPNRDLVVHAVSALKEFDRKRLDQFAVRTSERTWNLDGGRILQSMEQGFSVDAVEEFLAETAENEIPDNVLLFVRDLATRAHTFKGGGSAEIFLATDEHTALLVAHDKKAGKLCYHAGQNRLVIPSANLDAFRNALRALGYVLPPAGAGKID